MHQLCQTKCFLITNLANGLFKYMNLFDENTLLVNVEKLKKECEFAYMQVQYTKQH